MVRAATLAAVVLCGAVIGSQQTTREPRTFFTKQIGLSDAEIAAIDRGDAVAKVLPSSTPAEILLFGAVHVNAPSAAHASLALDMDRLRRLPGYLAVGQFSDPPVLSDLAGFTLEADDIKRLRQCRAGRCAMQLPAEAMRELQGAVDWSAADAGAQANDAVRRMTLALVRRYQEGGNSALGTYADKGRPFQVAEQFALLLSRSEPLPLSRPELNRYLLDYPGATLTNDESLFYWEKVDFGLKPTFRLNHAIAYEYSDP